MRFTKRGLCFFLLTWLCLTVSVQAQNPRKLAKKAENALFDDNPAEAIKLYEQAAAQQPANPKLQFRLGQLYLQQNQVPKALAA
jgi:TPR repeat protein